MASSKLAPLFSWFEVYRQWVAKHPDILSQVESLGRISSYLIAGRINKSPAFSEFLYSATNIVVLINDQILRSAEQQNGHVVSGNVFEKSRFLITTLEYLQVFLEITASRLGGSQAKWITIFIIQLIKFLWRAFILIKDRSGLAATRPLPPLNRKQFQKQLVEQRGFQESNIHQVSSTRSNVYTLKSGRVVRRVDGAPQLHRRTWALPPVAEEKPLPTPKTRLRGRALLGEVLYTAKPLCHLLAMKRYGSSSWLPWMLALSMDVSSLRSLREVPLNREERKEINRRMLMLLMYLLRSPFYDRFSSRILSFWLTKLGRLPLVGVLPKQLNLYLPYWQSMYSYNWD